MNYNLLKMTQMILSSMDGDEINDINDTVESRQVVDIIEQTWSDIIAQIDYPEQYTFFELEASGDVARPTLMRIPDDILKVEWIQYDRSKLDSTIRDFQYVWPMARQTFLNRMNGLDTDQDDVYQFNFMVGAETFDIRGKKTAAPNYYMVVDNRSLIFDNYDADVATTLVKNRTYCYGQKKPVFVRDNEFEFSFEPKQFTLFFNEAKSQCFLELKQLENGKAEQRARRGWVHSQRKKENAKGAAIRDWTPNYGRGRVK